MPPLATTTACAEKVNSPTTAGRVGDAAGQPRWAPAPTRAPGRRRSPISMTGHLVPAADPHPVGGAAPRRRTARTMPGPVPQVTWKRGTELPCRARCSRRVRPTGPAGTSAPRGRAARTASRRRRSARRPRPTAAASSPPAGRSRRCPASRPAPARPSRGPGAGAARGSRPGTARRTTSSPARPGTAAARRRAGSPSGRPRPARRVATRPDKPAPMTMTSASMAGCCQSRRSGTEATGRTPYAGRHVELSALASDSAALGRARRLAAQLVATGPDAGGGSSAVRATTWSSSCRPPPPADVAAGGRPGPIGPGGLGGQAARPSGQRVLLDFHDAVLDRRDDARRTCCSTRAARRG